MTFEHPFINIRNKCNVTLNNTLFSMSSRHIGQSPKRNTQNLPDTIDLYASVKYALRAYDSVRKIKRDFGDTGTVLLMNCAIRKSKR